MYGLFFSILYHEYECRIWISPHLILGSIPFCLHVQQRISRWKLYVNTHHKELLNLY